LALLEFLRNAFLRSAPSALDHVGGAYGLRSWGAPEEEPVLLALTAGELRWELLLSVQGPTLAERLGERVTRGEETLLSRTPLSDHLTYRGEERQCDERLALRLVFDSERPEELVPLADLLTDLRVYRGYNLSGLRMNGSRQGGDLYLHTSGENAFTVLRNWRDRRNLRPQYDCVIGGLKSAFPELFADLDFQIAGLTTTADIIDPRWSQPYPVALAPNGLLTGLLHLIAVAGAQEGSLVAIDEFENTLHPYAIRQLTEAIREWADLRDLTVCLASHSPVLLDEFKEQPGSVFVMEEGLESRPVALSALYDPDWLARFSLGRLFAHGEFGGQRQRVGEIEGKHPTQAS
jgi:hypothetical protein